MTRSMACAFLAASILVPVAASAAALDIAERRIILGEYHASASFGSCMRASISTARVELVLRGVRGTVRLQTRPPEGL
jgi:hypothetical protein